MFEPIISIFTHVLVPKKAWTTTTKTVTTIRYLCSKKKNPVNSGKFWKDIPVLTREKPSVEAIFHRSRIGYHSAWQKDKTTGRAGRRRKHCGAVPLPPVVRAYAILQTGLLVPGWRNGYACRSPHRRWRGDKHCDNRSEFSLTMVK